MWRYDAGRRAASPEALPAELHLQWVRQFPPLQPAWLDQPRLRFDVAREPVVLGRLLFFGSSTDDCVRALDTATGGEAWRYYANGPIRFAPAAWRDRLFVASDDGYLHCLQAATGRLLWTFRGGPPTRTVLGNGRLISLWPARGAPVVNSGIVYFAAGIWPFEGVFIHALDAATGKVVWTNDSAGAQFILQPHDSPALAGVAPQGYLAVSGDKLLVPCGRSVPACFDLATGKLLYYHLAANAKTGGFLVAANRLTFANGNGLFGLAEGNGLQYVGHAPVLADDVVYGSQRGRLCAFDLRGAGPIPAKRSALAMAAKRWSMDRLWRFAARGPAFIKAGTRLYAGGRHIVQAIDLPSGRGEPRVSWQSRLCGTPASMAAANGRLFVSTLEGHLYCFGPTPTSAAMPEIPEDILVPTNSPWRHLDDGSQPSGNWMTPAFDDRRWAAGPTELGDEDDLASLFPNSPPRKIPLTTYFRCAFDVAPEAGYRSLRLGLIADDGAVVYLNGREAGRVRLPVGPLTPHTRARERADEDAADRLELDVGLLAKGRNVLAVEIHKVHSYGSELAFELELTASKGTPAPLPAPARPPEDEWTRQAAEILKRTAATEGYALVLGLGSGRLAEELARQSSLSVVAIEADPRRVEAARRRLDAAGLPATRVAIREADPQSFPLPPWFASLATSEDVAALGSPTEPALAQRLFRSLRPYGGVACLPTTEAPDTAFAQARLEGARVERSGGYTLVRRPGPLPGSADWTHQYADAGNSAVSRDDLVKAPLGVLWFGGTTHEAILPRHGHGPSQHVVGGRLIIEGPDSLRATDVYTGRFLWKVDIPGLGLAFDNTSHQPGANATGSNYVSAHDGIYVAYGSTCLRLDPATGRLLSRFALPPLAGSEEPPALGFVSVSGDVLIVGASPPAFDTDADFTTEELAGIKKSDREALARWLARIPSNQPLPSGDSDSDVAVLAACLNALLDERPLSPLLPKVEKPSDDLEAARDAIAAYHRLVPDPPAGDRELKRLNRSLLEEHRPELPSRRVVVGRPNVYSGTSSRWLAALDRHTGNVLWIRTAAHGFLHNAIASDGDRPSGAGKVFCIDRLPEGVARARKRRGQAPGGRSPFDAPAELFALDARTGTVVWHAADGVFGSWLAYSPDHDILLEAARASRDMLPEPAHRMVARLGSDGTLLWDKPNRYNGPCMLHGDTIITQSRAYSLLTGDEKTRKHPLTGEEIPWRFVRGYGCDTAIASRHLITFRSAAAGYYDLERDSGTGTLGGFRSGCTANLIAANGVLTAPDYTRTCTCSYQNQTSLALVHDPDVETWTYSEIADSDEPVRQVGINFGAPGDHLADNDGRTPSDVLWLDYPSVGGPSPDPPIETQPESPDFLRHHSSWVEGGGLKWVAASGVVGLKSVSITLANDVREWRREHPTLLSRLLDRASQPRIRRAYTVRLHFIEPGDAGPGERVWDVYLQDQRVIRRLDVARETGGPRRPLVKEFKGVEVTDDLTISFSKPWTSRSRDPVLCGVEIVAEGW